MVFFQREIGATKIALILIYGLFLLIKINVSVRFISLNTPQHIVSFEQKIALYSVFVDNSVSMLRVRREGETNRNQA